jgi:hypothetical protein
MQEENVIRTEEDAHRAFFSKPFFAFLDILGFRELVRNNKHSDLVELYKRIVNYQVEFHSQYSEERAKAEKERLREYYKPNGLRLVNISDSIMLWTDNSREGALYEIVSAVKMILSISMSVGIPLRGAIVKGDVEILEQKDSLSIIGRGLVSAYEMESKQQWSGCVIDEGIFIFLNSLNKVVANKKTNISLEKADWLVKRHDVPLKIDGKETTRELFAVNWAEGSTMSEEEIRNSFGMHNKRKNETERVKKSTENKIENTLEFWRKNK